MSGLYPIHPGMKRSFRKLNRDDFSARIDTVQRAYNQRTPYAYRRDRTGERPVFWTFFSLVWTYVAIFISFNRPQVDSFLSAKKIPAHLHDPILSALAAALAVSAILLVVHILRALIRTRGYYNSGSILLGFALAAGLHLTPSSVYQSLFGMLDDDTQDVLATTASKVMSIDWNDIVVVSSQGQ